MIHKYIECLLSMSLFAYGHDPVWVAVTIKIKQTTNRNASFQGLRNNSMHFCVDLNVLRVVPSSYFSKNYAKLLEMFYKTCSTWGRQLILYVSSKIFSFWIAHYLISFAPKVTRLTFNSKNIEDLWNVKLPNYVTTNFTL